MRAALIVNDTVVTEPVPRAVQYALREVERRMQPDIDTALAPYGLTAFDIAAPAYRRVVYVDECPIYARVYRDRMR